MSNYKKDKSYIKQRLEYVNSVDYISELEEQIENLQIEKEDYKSRCEEAQYLILHELSHLKANDEITWNKEFYDENNKLYYRKLCIELLNQIKNKLNGDKYE